jgi:non-canonical (house-cleaning) NTP pyrophosphatase
MENIILGSTSKHKLESIKKACLNLDLSFNVLGIKTKSGQNEQPIGFDETFAGALARAKRAQEAYPLEIALGIESGVIFTEKPIAVSVDLAVVVVLFKDQMIITTSNGMVFPEKYVNIAKRKGFENYTIGSAIASKIGGDATDPHSTLSNGSLSRQETLTRAIEVALRLLLNFKPNDVAREQIIRRRYCSFKYLDQSIENVVEVPNGVSNIEEFVKTLANDKKMLADNPRHDKPYYFFFFGQLVCTTPLGYELKSERLFQTKNYFLDTKEVSLQELIIEAKKEEGAEPWTGDDARRALKSLESGKCQKVFQSRITNYFFEFDEEKQVLL